MASIWYIGSSDDRLITAAQWAAAGFAGATQTEWNYANGWSLPQAGFTTGQVNYLNLDREFMVNAPDTPNTRKNGTEGVGPLDPSQTLATKAYVDARIGTIGAPPGGTPDFALYSVASGAAVWYRKQQIRDALFSGRMWFLDETTVDGVADDVQIQAQLDAASAAGGGVVNVSGFVNLWLAHQLNLHQGVFLHGDAKVRNLNGATGVHLSAAAGYPDPYIVNVPANTIGASVSGVCLVGRGKSATALGGIYIATGCYNIGVYDNWIGNMSDTCLRFAPSTVACYVEKNIMGYDVTGRTLTSRTPVMEVDGTDHAIADNECFAGPSNSAGAGGQYYVSYPGTYYRTGIWVKGGTHKFSGNVPEFADCGWYIEAAECVWLGDRADYSAGHGWIVDSTNGTAQENLYVGCRTFGAGIALINGGGVVYHGVVHQNGAAKNRWVDYNFWIGGASAPFAGYGWTDFVSGNSVENENTCWMPNIDKREVVWDTIYRIDPATSCWPDSVGVTKRPPARHSQGSWNRGGSGFPGRTSQSDGQFYYDLGGDVVGNLAPPRASEQIFLASNASGSVIAWEPFTGIAADCAVALIYYYNGATAQAQKIKAASVARVTANAQGVTNGYVTLGNVVALHSSSDMPQVQAGRSYTVGFEVVAEDTSKTYTVQLLCRWWNAATTAFVDGTLTTALGSSLTGGNLVFRYTQGNVCPAGYTQLEVVPRISRTGLILNEQFWAQHMFVGLGAHTAWSET